MNDSMNDTMNDMNQNDQTSKFLNELVFDEVFVGLGCKIFNFLKDSWQRFLEAMLQGYYESKWFDYKALLNFCGDEDDKETKSVTKDGKNVTKIE